MSSFTILRLIVASPVYNFPHLYVCSIVKQNQPQQPEHLCIYPIWCYRIWSKNKKVFYTFIILRQFSSSNSWSHQVFTKVMSSCRMNAIKNKLLYLFCRVESLLLYHKNRIKHNDTLNADAYIWWKVKVGKNTLGATFVYVWLVWGVVEHFLTLSKALILSKGLNKRKLDSLAYSCGMRVFACILKKVLVSILIGINCWDLHAYKIVCFLTSRSFHSPN